MNRLISLQKLAGIILLALAPAAVFADADTDAIRQQLQRYEAALNASDSNTVMALYAPDAVFMAQNYQPAVGEQAIRESYTHIFSVIKLSVKFEFDEVTKLSPQWALVRTRSTGKVKVLGTDLPESAEANQEVFLLHKDKAKQWRIARYIFASTLAAKTE